MNTIYADKWQDVWEACENPPAGSAAVADLYHWSTNYDPGKGPFTMFLDMIGWSEDQIGENLWSGDHSLLGYVELDKLGKALCEYADRPHDVQGFVDRLMELEAQG